MKTSVLPIETCDVAYALAVVGGKWKIAVLWKLLHKRMRFSELRRSLPSISETVLIAQLKELERDGLVNRIVYPEVPPHVEYELTAQGEQLDEALNSLRNWGGSRRAAVNA